jgi:hypothetical protein
MIDDDMCKIVYLVIALYFVYKIYLVIVLYCNRVDNIIL